MLTRLFFSPHRTRSLCSPATPFLICQQMQQWKWRWNIRLSSTTRKHALSWSVLVQLNSITISPICLHWMFAIVGTGTRLRRGFILCGLTSRILQSHFVFNINEAIEQGLEKFILNPGRFLGKSQFIINVPNGDNWMVEC